MENKDKDNFVRVIVYKEDNIEIAYVSEEVEIVTEIIDSYFDCQDICEFYDDGINGYNVPFIPFISVFKNNNIYSVGRINKEGYIGYYFITLNFAKFYCFRSNDRFVRFKKIVDKFLSKFEGNNNV